MSLRKQREKQMPYDPHKHHRRSIRLKGYDYSQAGGYFVTICTEDRECLFGEIIDGEMNLSDLGRLIEQCWRDLPQRFPWVSIDEFVVMPNHVHGVIWINREDGVGAPFASNEQDSIHPSEKPIQQMGKKLLRAKDAPTSNLGYVVGAYKSITGIRYRIGVSRHKWNESCETLWQRNYYEHIIRGEKDLNAIRTYIRNNPINWWSDEENQNREWEI
jgi:REP element-mobilizing transposase RayT